jgi:hypothetical protein
MPLLLSLTQSGYAAVTLVKVHADCRDVVVAQQFGSFTRKMREYIRNKEVFLGINQILLEVRLHSSSLRRKLDWR